MTFFLDIETPAGTRYGEGPIGTATRWSHTRRLDRAGRVSTEAPATDERTALLALRRYVRCRSLLVSDLVDGGLGIIDTIGVDTDGKTLTIGGDDLLRELAMRSVGFTPLKDTSPDPDDPAVWLPISIAAALDIIVDRCNSNSPSLEDWTIDAATYASTGDTMSGGDTLTNVVNIQNWQGREGSPIYGAGIPDGTTVVTVGASSLTLSAGATATATGVATHRSRVYHEFAGESILQALIKIGELTGTHFRLGSGRQIVWLYNVHPPSGVRAVTDADPTVADDNPDICLITRLSYEKDSSDLISRVHPFGSGSGAARLALANSEHPGVPDPFVTTRLAPDGYVLNLDQNFIERTAAETDYGFNVRYETFNDVGVTVEPADPNYATALVNARNQLFDVAFEHLRSHSSEQQSYRLSVTKLDQEVLPGQTIRVVYRGFVDGYRWIDLDVDLLILEATIELDSSGIRTPGLVVATVDRWPTSDVALLISMVRQLQQAQAHRQR